MSEQKSALREKLFGQCKVCKNMRWIHDDVCLESCADRRHMVFTGLRNTYGMLWSSCKDCGAFGITARASACHEYHSFGKICCAKNVCALGCALTCSRCATVFRTDGAWDGIDGYKQRVKCWKCAHVTTPTFVYKGDIFDMCERYCGCPVRLKRDDIAGSHPFHALTPAQLAISLTNEHGMDSAIFNELIDATNVNNVGPTGMGSIDFALTDAMLDCGALMHVEALLHAGAKPRYSKALGQLLLNANSASIARLLDMPVTVPQLPSQLSKLVLEYADVRQVSPIGWMRLNCGSVPLMELVGWRLEETQRVLSLDIWSIIKRYVL